MIKATEEAGEYDAEDECVYCGLLIVLVAGKWVHPYAKFFEGEGDHEATPPGPDMRLCGWCGTLLADDEPGPLHDHCAGFAREVDRIVEKESS